MKSRIIFFSVLLVISIVYIGGCRRAGAWLVRDDSPVHADAMVMLMGSFSDRVVHAVDLYNSGRAGRLLIVEEFMGRHTLLEERGINVITNSQQALNAAVKLGIPADSIDLLPGDAQSTRSELVVVRDYLTRHPGIDTLIIVSSASHTRRASIIFSSAFRDAGMPVTVLSSPSPYSSFDAEGWWKEKEGIQAVVSEYIKIASYLVIERRRL
jgi:uncharacterized SAM-binding protein YcdF (DUF218 family)